MATKAADDEPQVTRRARVAAVVRKPVVDRRWRLPLLLAAAAAAASAAPEPFAAVGVASVVLLATERR